jgi:hypothetical protein
MYIGAVMLDRNTQSCAISTWSQLFEVEIAISWLEKCKTAGSHKIPAEIIQAGGEKLWSGDL